MRGTTSFHPKGDSRNGSPPALKSIRRMFGVWTGPYRQCKVSVCRCTGGVVYLSAKVSRECETKEPTRGSQAPT